MDSQRIRVVVALACGVALVAGPVQARTRKADKLLAQGQLAESRKEFDQALQYYQQALNLDSRDPAYQLAEQRARFKAGEFHIEAGRKLRNQQKLEEALAEFQKAFVTDPSSAVALQEVKATTDMIKQQQAAAPGTRILSPAERARAELESRLGALQTPPILQPISRQINSLRMNNQPLRILYETIGKLAGINVLFDPQQGAEGAGRNFNLDLNNVTLEEALNYVAILTHTFWKPIARNAIFVTQDTDIKRQEYQDEVIKVFYVQNATTPNEFQDIFNGVRTGVGLAKGIFQVTSQNAIVVRGTPDAVALVEKLIHDLDKPKSEVVMDVVVLEASRNKTRTLAAAIAGATGGLNVPIIFNPQNINTVNGNGNGSNSGNNGSGSGSSGSGSSGSGNSGSGSSNTGGGTTVTPTGTGTGTGTQQLIPLSRVGRLSTNDFGISLPGALIQALMTDSSTRVLQRPQIRATDGGKASLKIGSKIPYVSGSLNSAVATPGAIPYATTQFQQVDVGVNIDLQPHVNGPDDVSMHVKVEISSVISTEQIAGVAQPVIGQRVNEADIRLKDGEISVLGGLTDNEDQRATNGIPGVVNIPVLGYLFGTKTRNQTNDEILIGIVPHIVRAPDLSGVAERPVAAGTERVIRVLRGSEAGPAGSSSAPAAGPGTGAAPSATPGATPPPAANAPAAPPQPQSAQPQGVTPQPHSASPQPGTQPRSATPTVPVRPMPDPVPPGQGGQGASPPR